MRYSVKLSNILVITSFSLKTGNLIESYELNQSFTVAFVKRIGYS